MGFDTMEISRWFFLRCGWREAQSKQPLRTFLRAQSMFGRSAVRSLSLNVPKTCSYMRGCLSSGFGPSSGTRLVRPALIPHNGGAVEPRPPCECGLPRPARRLARPRTVLPRRAHLFDRCAHGRRALTVVENAADPSNPTEALALTRRLAQLFPHLYIELAYHHHPREKLINRGLVALAQRLDDAYRAQAYLKSPTRDAPAVCPAARRTQRDRRDS
jgi:hypothetical protein